MTTSELHKSTTSLVNVQREKNRGWVSLAASIGVIFLGSALALYITSALAAHGSLNPENENLMGEIFVMFAMVIACGIAGIANALMQIRSGRRSPTLTFFTIVSLFAAIVTCATAVF